MKTVHRLLPMAAIGGALLLLATAVAAADGVLHPFLVAQPKQAPQEVNLAVEIPGLDMAERKSLSQRQKTISGRSANARSISLSMF